MQQKTIFSKIIQKEVPANIVYEDDVCIAFYDIAPQAPVHILLVPKKEIVSLADLQEQDSGLMGHLVTRIPMIAKKLGLEDFRVVSNAGPTAGQSVFHLHFHLLGGRSFAWAAENGKNEALFQGASSAQDFPLSCS